MLLFCSYSTKFKCLLALNFLSVTSGYAPKMPLGALEEGKGEFKNQFFISDFRRKNKNKIFFFGGGEFFSRGNFSWEGCGTLPQNRLLFP